MNKFKTKKTKKSMITTSSFTNSEKVCCCINPHSKISLEDDFDEGKSFEDGHELFQHDAIRDGASEQAARVSV